jgi:hypothetical protein
MLGRIFGPKRERKLQLKCYKVVALPTPTEVNLGQLKQEAYIKYSQ